MASEPHRTVTFLELPPEIRNQIYKLLLTFTSSRSHTCELCLGESSRNPLNLHPVVLRLSRSIFREASAVLYGCNHFRVLPWRYPPVFADHPSRVIKCSFHISQIRSFHSCIRLDVYRCSDPGFLEAMFSGSEGLDLEVCHACQGCCFEYCTGTCEDGACQANCKCDYAKLKVYEGIRGVKRAVVHGTVPRKYAAWLERNMESSKERGTDWTGWEGGEVSGPQYYGREPSDWEEEGRIACLWPDL